MMKIKGITNTWPSYSAKEVKKISTILKSGKVNYWTGEECRNFEEEFASYMLELSMRLQFQMVR